MQKGREKKNRVNESHENQEKITLGAGKTLTDWYKTKLASPINYLMFVLETPSSVF